MFLDTLEKQGLSVRSRNLRLTAIHSFFRYTAFETPDHSAHIQRVLAIPASASPELWSSFSRVPKLMPVGRSGSTYLVRPPRSRLYPAGCANRPPIIEMTGPKRAGSLPWAGAHVRVVGKGRKERCTPIAKSTRARLKS